MKKLRQSKKLKKILIYLAALLVIKFMIGLYPLPVYSQGLKTTKFPRLANIYLKTPITSIEADQLVKWDVVILGMQVQDTNPEVFNTLRSKNPNITILAYLPSAEFPVSRLDILESPNGPWHELNSGINEQWWLRDDAGNRISFWAGNNSLNITNLAPTINGEKWNSHYVKFIEDEILATGHWDGVFFDSVWNDGAWINNGNLDLNNDGQKESTSVINTAWHEGMETMFSLLRQKYGQSIYLLGNGGYQYSEYLNGRMYESFPNAWENGWSGQVAEYLNFLKIGQWPQLSFINGDTNNTGNQTDYRDMRFALTSTLLGDGFFSYDWGTGDHSQLWWYDEFNVYLGQPKIAAVNVLDNNSSTIKNGVWRRDYENGLVIVNSTDNVKTINLGGNYEKIKGDQDKAVNNGQIVDQAIIPALDGLILRKPLNQANQNDFILGSSFTNGTFARVFNGQGQNIRNGFFAYQQNYQGGQKLIIEDLNNDGQKEIVTADLSAVYVYNQNGGLLKKFYPYGQNFKLGINLAVGDLDNKNTPYIITVPKKGAPAHVLTFNADGKQLNPGFFAYNVNFRGGASVAVADLDNDNKKEIITAAGSGGGPHVRVFDKEGRVVKASFFVFDSKQRSGLNLAAGDVNGDGSAEIVVSRMKGATDIQIYNINGVLLNQWSGFNGGTNGVEVAVTDIDGNKIDEILALGNEPFAVSLSNPIE